MATQASPGLNAPSAYQALPGVPPNMSMLAAMSAGLVPGNQRGPSNGITPNPTVLSLMANGGANGTQNDPPVLKQTTLGTPSGTAFSTVGGSPPPPGGANTSTQAQYEGQNDANFVLAVFYTPGSFGG